MDSSPIQDKSSNPCKKSKIDNKCINECQTMELSPPNPTGNSSFKHVQNLITIEVEQPSAESTPDWILLEVRRIIDTPH